MSIYGRTVGAGSQVRMRDVNSGERGVRMRGNNVALSPLKSDEQT
jgi:hypothetical protein